MKLLTTHGRVLAYLGQHPEATAEEIARHTGLRERSAHRLLRELEAAGEITVTATPGGRRCRTVRPMAAEALRQLDEKDGEG